MTHCWKKQHLRKIFKEKFGESKNYVYICIKKFK